MITEIKNKKVLLMGLGILAGGLNMAKWLLKQGARLTVTDLKTEDQLRPSLRKLKNKKLRFILGRHRDEDFLKNDIIVVNPDVPLRNHYVVLASRHGKQIENELTLFYKFCPSDSIIGVTGTRGKTTVTNWIGHFLKRHYAQAQIGGNSPDNPTFQIINKCRRNTPVVVESPSFLLEYLPQSSYAPHIAVITNIYRDHLNRYRDMTEYALTKAGIFKNQKKIDALILNADDRWTRFFLKQKPKARKYFFSMRQLQDSQEGIFVKNGTAVYLKLDSSKKLIFTTDQFVEKWGRHNLNNLLPAILAAVLAGVPTDKILRSIPSLLQIKFRQELVYQKNNLKIYNDTSATSPEATIAALERFSKQGRVILISGGTDRELDFAMWGKAVKKYLPKQDLVLLGGSATNKMLKELRWKGLEVCETLEQCLQTALKLAESSKGKCVIVFSPSSKSFEKFKNEFDRGRQFNALIKKILKFYHFR